MLVGKPPKPSSFTKGRNAMANRMRPNQILFFVSDDEKKIIKAKMAQLGTKNMGAYPAADAALESTDYLTRLDAYTFHEGFAHLLSYQATEIDCVDWHTPQLTEAAAASRAKLRLALMETDPDRQKQFLEEAVCGSYYEKFACMCGMLYLADRWETQGIDGLKSAFADYHGFAQRALSIRI